MSKRHTPADGALHRSNTSRPERPHVAKNVPPESPGDTGMAFAWQKYGEAKFLKDK